MNFLCCFLLSAVLGHSKKFPESSLYENSNQYIYGEMLDEQVFKLDGRTYTAVVLHPHGTLSYFTQQITLCDDVGGMFDQIPDGSRIVLTFSRYYTKSLCYNFSDVVKVGE